MCYVGTKGQQGGMLYIMELIYFHIQTGSTGLPGMDGQKGDKGDTGEKGILHYL